LFGEIGIFEISNEIFKLLYMKIEIAEETIKETTQCECKFKCLQNVWNSCCEVEGCNNNALVIFIKCIGSQFCIYKRSLGFSSFTCTCPTRIGIFKKLAI